MQIPCPLCKGSGVVMKTIKPQIAISDAKLYQVKELCIVCKGSGLVEAGYAAKQLGMIKDNSDKKDESDQQK